MRTRYGKLRYRPRRKYIRRARSIKKRGSVSTRIKKYVKKEIHRNIENKMRYNYGANQSIQTGQAATMTWPLIPPINVGVYTADRVGNVVKPVKGLWKCVVNLLPYDATTNNLTRPVWVKIWVVRDLKYTGQLSTMDATSFANFFNGNNTALPFQNNCLDTVFDVNTDNFRVLTTRLFKLGVANNSSGGYPGTASLADDSPAAKSISIDYSKYIKKALKFQDNTGYANNENLYFVIQAVAADGTSSVDQRMIEMHWTNRFYYEDA